MMLLCFDPQAEKGLDLKCIEVHQEVSMKQSYEDFAIPKYIKNENLFQTEKKYLSYWNLLHYVPSEK